MPSAPKSLSNSLYALWSFQYPTPTASDAVLVTLHLNSAHPINHHILYIFPLHIFQICGLLSAATSVPGSDSVYLLPKHCNSSQLISLPQCFLSQITVLHFSASHLCHPQLKLLIPFWIKSRFLSTAHNPFRLFLPTFPASPPATSAEMTSA